MKRLFDISLSTLLIVGFLPIMAVLAWMIWKEDRGPVLYRGERIGKGERPFRMLKFRTMRVDNGAGGPTTTSNDDPRITRPGHWIRHYKLDELPQLFNVWRGDMSFVGPRPQVAWAVETYSPEDRAILSIRPGITDEASIRFHNEGEIVAGYPDPDRAYMELIHPEKMRLARAYVQNQSLMLDLKILYKTAEQVWKKH